MPICVTLLLAFAVASGVAIDPAACSAAGTCVSEIQDVLDACDAPPAPSCSIILPPGIYVLDVTGVGTAALLSAPSAPNVLLSANGVVFNLTGAAGVISVGASSNFSIVGLTIDMQRSAYTLGSVLTANTTTAVLSVDPAIYPFTATDVAAFPYLASASGAVGWDATCGCPSGSFDVGSKDAPWPLTIAGAGIVSISPGAALLPSLVPGTYVLLTHTRAYSVVRAAGTAGIHFTNVTVHAGAGIAFLTNNVSDAITLSGVAVVPSRGRAGSVTAGSTHFANTRGARIELRDCTFLGAGDDGFNPASTYQELESIAADRRSAVVGAHGAPASPVGSPSDSFTFFSRRSFATLGQVQAEAFPGGNRISFSMPLPASVAPLDLLQARCFGVGVSAFVTSDTLNGSLQSKDDSPAYVLVDNCTFGGNRARGGLFKASNTLISNSRFSFTAMAAIQVRTQSGGSAAKNRNSRFTTQCASAGGP